MPEATTQTITDAAHKKQTWTLAIAIVLFALFLVLGIIKGFSVGKDRANLLNVTNIYTGLKYFYQDQDRYPTEDEFSGQKILAPYYMKSLPQPANITGTCKGFDQYIYSQQNPGSYALQFCLNNAVNGWNKGANTLTNE